MTNRHDSVGDLLTRSSTKDETSFTSKPNAHTRPSTAVGAIFSQLPPTDADKEAFGINSINHRKRCAQPAHEISGVVRMHAEADRFYNGIADARAQRPDTRGTLGIRYDSSNVAASIIHNSSSSSTTTQQKTINTTFTANDATRTSTGGLILPEPSPRGHRGGVTAEAAMRLRADHLRHSATGLTTTDEDYVSGGGKEMNLHSAPHSKGRGDHARVVRDQLGSSVNEVLHAHTNNASAVGSSANPYLLSSHHATPVHTLGQTTGAAVVHSRLYVGAGTAEALIRPRGLDDSAHPPGTASTGRRQMRRNTGDDDPISSSSSSISSSQQQQPYMTTYEALARGEEHTSPPRRRWYGGQHGTERNDPHKKTQIY